MAFDNIKLEKGLYMTSKGFTNSLEELDPSDNYTGTAFEGLDAYQRQLKRFDIKISGNASDTVEKFFMTTDSSALFPEYVSRAVLKGLEQASVLSRIVAATTEINSLDYRSIASVPSEDDRELKSVAQGAFIPETNVTTKENLVKLHKRGRMLVASYEAIRFQRLDLFTVTLRQIGAYIAKAQLKDAVDVLINGDGNDNEAEIIATAEENKLSYSDLISLWNSFSPYSLNTLIASPDIIQTLLNLEEFKDATAGLNFQATGKMITPIGSDLLKCSEIESGQLLGLDKTCALELVKAGSIVTEYDKLIDRQLERAAITMTAGFAKIFEGASKILCL